MDEDSNAPQPDEATLLARMAAINAELDAQPEPERMWELRYERGELTAQVWYLRRREQGR